MSIAFLICGKICSGKTHYAMKLCNKYNAYLLSCDELTFNNNSDLNFDSLLDQTKNSLYKKAKLLLDSGKNIVLDWGFWTEEERKYAMSCLYSPDTVIRWIYMDVADDLYESNINRRMMSKDNFIPDAGLLKKCMDSFEIPSEDDIDIWYINDGGFINRNIEYRNIIMRCDNPFYLDNTNSSEFFIRNYKDSDVKHWARLEYLIDDFESEKAAAEYFNTKYANCSEIFDRCFFAVDKNGAVIGSCIAWYDELNGESVSSLHWLVVDTKYQDLGVGKALLNSVMKFYKSKDAFPVYLHTQTWSYKAILLYDKFGFHLLKNQTFSDYINEYDLAIKVLKQYLPKNSIDRLINSAK